MNCTDKILLFIPMYNCEKQIVRVLNQLDNEVQSYLSKVIIVNNRSTDNGENVVKDYLSNHKFSVSVSLLRNDDNYGLGGSHKVAFSYALKNNFDYVIVLHGDDQGHINNILPYLKNGEYKKYDCFLGARFMKGSQLDGYSKFRTFGNKVFNCLFSIGARKFVYDLGSGLNIYSTKVLKDNFFHKFEDNLTFNCYMILTNCYYKHKVQFFPICWSEDDQVSNVKMMSQASLTLKLLLSYMVNRKKFLNKEHRIKMINNYSYSEIYRIN